MFTPFSQGELSGKTFAQRHLDLVSICDRVTELLEREKIVDLTGLRASPQRDGYIRYLVLEPVHLPAELVYSSSLWICYGSPLWLCGPQWSKSDATPYFQKLWNTQSPLAHNPHLDKRQGNKTRIRFQAPLLENASFDAVVQHLVSWITQIRDELVTIHFRENESALNVDDMISSDLVAIQPLETEKVVSLPELQRFLLSDAEILLDTKTQLQWACVDNGKGAHVSEEECFENSDHWMPTWSQAREYCKASRLGDFDDWRLPTVEELQSLVNTGDLHHTTCLDANEQVSTTAELVLSGSVFWASNNTEQHAATVGLFDGTSNWYKKTLRKPSLRVLPVRNASQS